MSSQQHQAQSSCYVCDQNGEISIKVSKNNGNVIIKSCVKLADTQNFYNLLGKLVSCVGYETEANNISQLQIRVDNETKDLSYIFDVIKNGQNLPDVFATLKRARIEDRRYRNLSFLLDTCYDRNIATNLDQALGILGGLLTDSGDENLRRCYAAALLFTVYLMLLRDGNLLDCDANVSEEEIKRELNAEKLMWIVELLRSYIDDDRVRRVIKICPWEGDVTALLYATLFYCNRYNNSVQQQRVSEVEVTIERVIKHAQNNNNAIVARIQVKNECSNNS